MFVTQQGSGASVLESVFTPYDDSIFVINKPRGGRWLQQRRTGEPRLWDGLKYWTPSNAAK